MTYDDFLMLPVPVLIAATVAAVLVIWLAGEAVITATDGARDMVRFVFGRQR